MVWVYDERKNLVDRFTKETYAEALIVLAGNYGHTPRYEIRKVA
jgi:hypothetical protein